MQGSEQSDPFFYFLKSLILGVFRRVEVLNENFGIIFRILRNNRKF